MAKKGEKTPDDVRRKISIAKTGHHVSNETRLKIGLASRGRKHSAATRKRISNAMTGELNPFFGKHHSERVKKLISAARLNGKPLGYHGIHDWVHKHKPKPALCEKCKKRPPRDAANISGKYLLDVNDWEWLCSDCHMWGDGRIQKNLIEGGKKTRFRRRVPKPID